MLNTGIFSYCENLSLFVSNHPFKFQRIRPIREYFMSFFSMGCQKAKWMLCIIGQVRAITLRVIIRNCNKISFRLKPFPWRTFSLNNEAKNRLQAFFQIILGCQISNYFCYLKTVQIRDVTWCGQDGRTCVWVLCVISSTFRKFLMFNCFLRFYLFVSVSCFVCHIMPESIVNLRKENNDLKSKVSALSS